MREVARALRKRVDVVLVETQEVSTFSFLKSAPIEVVGVWLDSIFGSSAKRGEIVW